VEEALTAAEQIGYPIIVRSAFSLGGLGSGFANNPEELRNLSSRSLSLSPQILIEKSLKDWKELEIEVVRDSQSNIVAVAMMENWDPLYVLTTSYPVFATWWRAGNAPLPPLPRRSGSLVSVLSLSELWLAGIIN
jgi:carbamoylphosphate synthase large subunit